MTVERRGGIGVTNRGRKEGWEECRQELERMPVFKLLIDKETTLSFIHAFLP